MNGKENLFPYQVEGIEEAVKRGGCVLIADEPGLGKTVQSLGVIEQIGEFPFLIVCPAGLRRNWKKEIDLWVPDLSERVKILRPRTKNQKKFEFPSEGIVITSYELASKNWEEISRWFPKTIILDESQAIKNRESARTKRLKYIVRAAKLRILLSGTPILNRPIELYPQLEFVGCPNLPDIFRFARKFCDGKWKIVGQLKEIDPKTGKRKLKKVFDMKGASNLLQLEKLIAPCVIRRRKKDVLTQLPDKMRVALQIEKELPVEGEVRLREMCRAVLKNTRNKPKAALKVLRSHQQDVQGNVFQAYHEIGQMKAPVAVEFAENNASVDSPLVIYAHHRDVIVEIWKALKGTDLRIGVITGKVNDNERARLIEQFQGGDLDVMICSIMAAYGGITLTRARDLLMVETPWSPMIAFQCEDRIHRIGQKNGVLIRYLTALGTYDEILWRFVEKKAKNISDALDGGKGQTFTAADVEKVGGEWWDVVEQIMIEEALKNG